MLIVGLAPAAHGANRTGRMFTGDRSGEWLYRALHKAGFANRPGSEHRDDDLRLLDCAITATSHFAPPGNKPDPQEIANCQTMVSADHPTRCRMKVFLALGQTGWRAIADEFRRARNWWTEKLPQFGHANVVKSR